MAYREQEPIDTSVLSEDERQRLLELGKRTSSEMRESLREMGRRAGMGRNDVLERALHVERLITALEQEEQKE